MESQVKVQVNILFMIYHLLPCQFKHYILLSTKAAAKPKFNTPVI